MNTTTVKQSDGDALRAAEEIFGEISGRKGFDLRSLEDELQVEILNAFTAIISRHFPNAQSVNEKLLNTAKTTDPIWDSRNSQEPAIPVKEPPCPSCNSKNITATSPGNRSCKDCGTSWTLGLGEDLNFRIDSATAYSNQNEGCDESKSRAWAVKAIRALVSQGFSLSEAEAIVSPESDLLHPFTVAVLHDRGRREWQVKATSENDALQLAFALDGGWSRNNRDASEMLELAKSYCSICMKDKQ